MRETEGGDDRLVEAQGICDMLDLSDLLSKKYRSLSGGQKRRIEIARALLHKPEILFLDEPTTGLDPKTRKLIWEQVLYLKQQLGMTIFLTTHSMEEASMAEHIVIINKGKIIADATPFELKEKYTTDLLRLDVTDKEEVTIIIRCHQLDDKLLQFIYEAKMRKEKLTGMLGGTIHLIEPMNIFYFEAVDNKVFIYCKEQVYESKLKLYEIEAMFRDTSFFRASKSCILNLDKISNITSAFNGRLETTLKNGEKIIISRQYVPALKEKLGI